MRRDWKKKIQMRPDRVENVRLVEEHLHPAYDLEWDKATDAGETGLLTLFVLKSRDPQLPSFRGRWDIRQDAVDVDLLDRAEKDGKTFKAGKKGYRGHHSTKMTDRSYQIDIAIPGHDIFRAVLGFVGSGTTELHDEINVIVSDSLRIINVDTGEEITLQLPEE